MGRTGFDRIKEVQTITVKELGNKEDVEYTLKNNLLERLFALN